MTEAAGEGSAETGSSTPRVGPAKRQIRRPGRPGGSSDTRERILAAARASFGERGFEAATIRAIGLRAGTDPALVHHYFGTKQQLFVAAMELPIDFATLVPQLVAGPPGELGERFIRFLLETWETPAIRPLLMGVFRSATTDPVAAGMLRQILTEGPLLALTRASDRPDAQLRASLAGSQLVGLMMARYIVGIEPLASAPKESIVRAIGPTIQRYLTGTLSAGTV